jgi:hypothetical protein
MPDTSTEVVISSQTLGSAASSITFSSIPATYTDLRLVFVLKNTSADNPIVRLNSDSGSNYSRTFIRGDGSAVSSQRGSNTTETILGYNYSGASAQWTFYTLDFFSYAGSTNKTFLITSSEDENGVGYVYRMVSLYRSTSPITTITLSNFSSNTFAAGTTATLYGIL